MKELTEKQEEYLANIKLHTEGLHTFMACEEHCEGYYTKYACDVCGDNLAGNRHPVAFFHANPDGSIGEKLKGDYDCCEDCQAYIANGDLPRY